VKPSQQRHDEALALLREGRLDDAADAYRALLADDPTNAGVLHLFGIVEGQRGRYTHSVELVEASLRHAPQVAAAHANLGNALHALARYDEALASYRQALQLQPGHRNAQLGQGKACWSLGRLTDALDSYDAVLAQEPDLPEALMNRGDILLALGRRDEAVAALRRAIACGADEERIHYVLASIGVEPMPGVAPLAYVRDLFDSYAERFDEALVERLVLELAPREFDVGEWAGAVSSAFAADLAADRIRHVAWTELVLEGTRRPWLAEEVARWHAAHLRLAEQGLRAAGASDPHADAPLLVAVISGFMLGQLVTPTDDFEERVLRPALERLFTKLVEPVTA
jgi:tetratricopeptide (TPR) repeat protein